MAATPGNAINLKTLGTVSFDGVSSVSSYNLFHTSGTLTNTQIKNTHASPVQIIAAPGAGSMVKLIHWTAKLNYGGNNAFTNAGGAALSFYYSTSTQAGVYFSSSNITQAAIFTNLFPSFLTLSGAVSTYDNLAINLYNPSATEIAGNAANDNTMSYDVLYQIITL